MNSRGCYLWTWIFLGGILISCSKDEIVERSIFYGVYQAIEDCPDKDEITYEVEISENPGTETGVLVRNFANLGDEIVLQGNALGYSMVIEGQTVSIPISPDSVLVREFNQVVSYFTSEAIDTILQNYRFINSSAERFCFVTMVRKD